MTNEQKAIRLEELAKHKQNRGESLAKGIASDIALSDAALLRESAALWRERDGVRWEQPGERWFSANYKGYELNVLPSSNMQGQYYFDISRQGQGVFVTYHPTLDAAKAAAVAWVDQQEQEAIFNIVLVAAICFFFCVVITERWPWHKD